METLEALFEQSKEVHLEICAVISILRKQADSENGYKLRTLKEFRRLTLLISKFDLKVRRLTNDKSKEILERNSQKRRNKF